MTRKSTSRPSSEPAAAVDDQSQDQAVAIFEEFLSPELAGQIGLGWTRLSPLLAWLVATTRPPTTVALVSGDETSFLSLCEAVHRTGAGESCIAVELGRSQVSDPSRLAFQQVVEKGTVSFGPLVKAYTSEAASLEDLAPGPAVDLLHLALSEEDDRLLPNLDAWFEMMRPGGVVVVTTVAAGVSSNFDKAKGAVSDRYPSVSIPLGKTLEAVVAQVPIGGMTPAIEFLRNMPTTVDIFLAVLGRQVDVRDDLTESALPAAGLRTLIGRLMDQQQTEREALQSALRAYVDLTARLSLDLADARSELATQLEAARIEREQLARGFFDRFDELTAKISTSASKYTSQLEDKDREIENQERRVEAYAARAADAQSVLDDMRTSTSWRLTAPLRFASHVLARQRHRGDVRRHP